MLESHGEMDGSKYLKWYCYNETKKTHKETVKGIVIFALSLIGIIIYQLVKK